jgi:hypothetical protein
MRHAACPVKIDYVSAVNGVVVQTVLDASSLQAIPATRSPHTDLPSRPEGRHIMKKIHLQFAAAALAALAGNAANAQVSVGASVNINVPGVYGRVDIGAPGVAFVAPPVVYAQPMVIAPSPVAIQQRPIYLYVPEAHQHDWAHHCAAYGACGQPVYFVREQWVHDRYVQHYPHDHRFDHEEREHGHGHDRDHGDRDHDDRDREDHDRGHDHDRR